MWRRILQIPFDVVIPEEERDPQVKATLTNPRIAGPAILNWMIQGCLDWQVIGLKPPERVTRVTEEYRRGMNPATDFLEERCVLQEDAQADNTELYKEYQRWAADSGIRRPLGRKGFTQALKALGFEQDRRGGARSRYWPGIGILGEDRLIGN